ncbi:HNH endonuclease [Mycobacteroides chelonae]|uniref:HNH endonuclease n=1 Tax=Mycobacteroides chelonae TaxID=1774 RepID=UPI0019357E33|nr:HNH endonuclease [Mycobacteroides chelonae]
MADGTCSIDGCTSPQYCKRVCHLHYKRLKRLGTAELPKRSASCAADGCAEKVLARALCRRHYERQRKYGHASHLWTCAQCGKKFDKSNAATRCVDCTSCAVAGCREKAWARGWCGVHYARWHRFGDPQFIDRRPCKSCGSLLEIGPGVGRGNGVLLYCNKCRGESPQEYRAFARSVYAERIKKYQRAWYQRNHAHVLAYSQKYAQENKSARRDWIIANRATVRQWAQRRRARLRDNGVYKVTPKDLDRIISRHNSSCAYCLGPLSDSTLTWDHIIPIARGGTHSIGNLAPACKPCNSGKRDRPALEWRMYLLSGGKISHLSVV